MFRNFSPLFLVRLLALGMKEDAGDGGCLVLAQAPSGSWCAFLSRAITLLVGCGVASFPMILCGVLDGGGRKRESAERVEEREKTSWISIAHFLLPLSVSGEWRGAQIVFREFMLSSKRVGERREEAGER